LGALATDAQRVSQRSSVASVWYHDDVNGRGRW